MLHEPEHEILELFSPVAAHHIRPYRSKAGNSSSRMQESQLIKQRYNAVLLLKLSLNQNMNFELHIFINKWAWLRRKSPDWAHYYL